MKLSTAFPLLAAAAVPALASSHNRALSSRQAHVGRGLIDICVGLDVDLTLLDVQRDGMSFRSALFR